MEKAKLDAIKQAIEQSPVLRVPIFQYEPGKSPELDNCIITSVNKTRFGTLASVSHAEIDGETQHLRFRVEPDEVEVGQAVKLIALTASRQWPDAKEREGKEPQDNWIEPGKPRAFLLA